MIKRTYSITVQEKFGTILTSSKLTNNYGLVIPDIQVHIKVPTRELTLWKSSQVLRVLKHLSHYACFKTFWKEKHFTLIIKTPRKTKKKSLVSKYPILVHKRFDGIFPKTTYLVGSFLCMSMF